MPATSFRTVSAAVLAVAAAVIVPPAAHAVVPSNNGKIAFARSLGGGNTEIFAVQPSGAGLSQLTNRPGTDRGPAWSPDGRRIAFTSDRAGGENVFVMNADGSGVTQLTSSAGASREPAWSPDGTRIAFTSDRDGDPEIYVMAARPGASATQLTHNTFVEEQVGLVKVRRGHDVTPTWSPDGTRIAFSSDRSPRSNYEIYVMRADGSGQTAITSSAGWDRQPSWAPNGSSIALASSGNAGDGIYLVSPAGGGLTSRANDTSWDSDPAYAPDGTGIAYLSEGNPGGDGLWVMNVDGSGARRLTLSSRDSDPDWQPCPTCAPPAPAGGRPSPQPSMQPGRPQTGAGTTQNSAGSTASWTSVLELAAGGRAGSAAIASAPSSARRLRAWTLRLGRGDVFSVRTGDVKTPTFSVRLLGVTTRGLGRCRATARKAMRRWLFSAGGKGRRLTLVLDPHARALDSGGRLKAYVERPGRGKSLQLALLGRGLARLDAEGRRKIAMRRTFRAAETQARRAKRGRWGGCRKR